jgi:F-type H+-transporting ATPase subunit delta
MPKLSNKDIAEAIHQSLKGKSGEKLSLGVKDAVKFLAKKRLISKSSYILEALGDIIDKEEGRVKVVIKSANKIGDRAMHDIKKEIIHRYKAKDIQVIEEIDQRLLGGVRIEVGDEVIDLTLKNKIAQLQEYLTNA